MNHALLALTLLLPIVALGCDAPTDDDGTPTTREAPTEGLVMDLYAELPISRFLWTKLIQACRFEADPPSVCTLRWGPLQGDAYTTSIACEFPAPNDLLGCYKKVFLSHNAWPL